MMSLILDKLMNEINKGKQAFSEGMRGVKNSLANWRLFH